MLEMFSNAAAYEWLMGRWSARLAPLFAGFARVGGDGRVLDVGCGTGALVKFLADASDRSIIVGIDHSQPFIEYARSRFTCPRFSFDVGDAMELPYPSHSFDQSLSLLVFMHIPQPEKAASEMRRVTRPDGTVATCTWAHPGLEMAAIFWEEAVRIDPHAKTRKPESRPCTRPGQLTEIWLAAGFEAVEETTLDLPTIFGSFDDYWIPFTSGAGPAGVYVETLSPDHRQALREGLRKRLRGHREDGPISLKATALAVRGTVPS